MKTALSVLVLATVLAATAIPTMWGEDGHRMVGLVAAEELPQDMPEFFRNAAPQLSYLNPEPDRWRDRDERRLDPAMDAHHAAEHYVDFELIRYEFLDAPNRRAYLDSLAAHDVGDAGLLTFRILELTQRIRVGFRQWRAEEDPEERRFIEQRIINDAGILGHYVADGANPHHTTVHHHGWAEGYPNPNDFTTDRSFHGRFESEYVRANVITDDVRAAIHAQPRAFAELRPAILEFLRDAHGKLEMLYRLDQEETFSRHTSSEQHHAFAVDRLARGAEMLRDLWWTAWVTSQTAMEE